MLFVNVPPPRSQWHTILFNGTVYFLESNTPQHTETITWGHNNILRPSVTSWPSVHLFHCHFFCSVSVVFNLYAHKRTKRCKHFIKNGFEETLHRCRPRCWSSVQLCFICRRCQCRLCFQIYCDDFTSCVFERPAVCTQIICSLYGRV